MADTTLRKIGFIDIGSNTVRLVILEVDQSHRLIDESKETIRLAERIQTDGSISLTDLRELVQILHHFRLLCEAQHTSEIRAVATAAIRNASNRSEIIDHLQSESGLKIEILSGEDEARTGFLGVVNTIDVERGFIIDIGGGSTEITYFEHRQMVHGISIPIGAVNAGKRYADEGMMSARQVTQLRSLIFKELRKHPWMRGQSNLPLIGLGGTCRTAGKIDQAQRKYSFPVIHHYEMSDCSIAQLIEQLQVLTIEQRKKLPNLGKDRADIILPGLLILQTVIDEIRPSRLIISGSGLRDGLYFDTVMANQPILPNLIDYSVQNLLAHYPPNNNRHQHLVQSAALILFDATSTIIEPLSPDIPRARLRTILASAAMLYEIGVSINYYQFHKHTFYLLTNSRIDGLSHREILLTALIASYRSKNRARELFAKHKDILSENDLECAVRLGTLLELAIALDRSKTQTLAQFTAHLDQTAEQIQSKLTLFLRFSGDDSIEQRELLNIKKEMKKVWGFPLFTQCE